MVMIVVRDQTEVERFPNRVIPVPREEDFDSSSFSTTHPLLHRDQQTIQNIHKGFVESGVLDRPVEARPPQSMKELKEMVDEAIALSKSEKELRPAHYDSERDEELGADLSAEDDWANPSLDGVDDYGHQVFPNESRGLPRNPL